MNIEYEKQMGNNIRRLRMYYELTQEQLSAKLQTKGIDITSHQSGNHNNWIFQVIRYI